VKQRVLSDGRCELWYQLSPDAVTYLGPSLAVMGGGGDPPPGLIQRAKRYAEQHKVRLLALLSAARYGAFRADRGGVSAVLQTDVGEVSAWFTRWDDQRPVVRRASAAYEVAQWAAISAFLDVPEDVRKRLFRIARPADKHLHAAQHHVITCLRWDSTQWTQSVAQLWELAQRAGLDTSVGDIADAARELALLGRITQKTGDSADCFWLTDAQLAALGGSAVPAWANGEGRTPTPTIFVREVRPGPNRQPEHALPASAATPCTRAPEGTDPSDAMTLDHLTPRDTGQLYAYDDDSEPWPGGIVTLADCKVGDLIYLNRSNWVASPAYWTLYELVAPDAE